MDTKTNKSWIDVFWEIINIIIAKFVGDKKQQKIDNKILNDDMKNKNEQTIIDSHKNESKDISNIQNELNDKFK